MEKKKRIIMNFILLLVIILIPQINFAGHDIQKILLSPNREVSGLFGYALSEVGNTNGGGSVYVIVGAPGDSPDVSPVSAGRAYLINSEDGKAVLTLKSPNEKSYGMFGSSVSGIPDLTGDGVDDIIVGAFNEANGSSPVGAGRAYIFSSATGALIHTLQSPNEFENGSFGCMVSGVPDLTGDGMGDVIVNEDAYLPGQTGKVYVFNGATGALVRTLTSPDNQSGATFGNSLSGISDITGDGLGDFIIGACTHNGTTEANAGMVYVYNGATGALYKSLSSPKELSGGEFGSWVSKMPDATGDRIDDIIVGARYEKLESAPGGSGIAYIFNGSTGALIHTLSSSNPEIWGAFGNSVSGVPDITGDGLGEVVVGAPNESPGTSPANAGRAYIFNGANGAFIQELKSPYEVENGLFGYMVAGVTDLLHDGKGDVVVGTINESGGTLPLYSGAAYLFAQSPEVLSIKRNDPNPSNKTSVDYTVTFDQIVKCVDIADFSLSTTGSITDTTVTLVQSLNLNNTYKVTVNTGSGNGTIRLDLNDNDSIKSLAGLRLGGNSPGDGDFVSGDVYTIDKTLPSIPAGIILESPNPTNRDAVVFSVNFDKFVGDSFHAGDISVLGSLAAGATVSVDGATTQSFKLIVSPSDSNANGTIGVSIAGNVQDAAGNVLAVPVNSPLYTIRNYTGDKNDDGDVNAAELNETVLYYRHLLP